MEEEKKTHIGSLVKLQEDMKISEKKNEKREKESEKKTPVPKETVQISGSLEKKKISEKKNEKREKESEKKTPVPKETVEATQISEKREKESSPVGKESSPVGIPGLPALPKNPKDTVEGYERRLVCCKLQVAMSLVKLHHLENKLVKKERSSSRFTTREDSSKIEQEIVVCRQYIKTKQSEFLRLRPLWRKAKRLLLSVDEDPAIFCNPISIDL